MNEQQQQQLAKLLQSQLDGPVEIVRLSRCSGGCINAAHLVDLADGRQFFVKSKRVALHAFHCEARGLEELRSTECIAVPQVLGVGELPDGLAFLAMEAIPTAPPSAGFWESFGRSLAELHRHAAPSRFGYHEANFIGATPQPNEWTTTWSEFYASQRLTPQLKLACASNLIEGGLESRFRLLIERLPRMLECEQGSADAQPRASLLHGDLWSGNYLARDDGAAVLIDPAVYYGHREAELSLPLLFGGFPRAFYDAYEEAWPLEADWRSRNELYQLYHLMNHANLFGGGYIESCVRILNRFL